ncbi:MAG TPA: YeeE/YedE thiosulfate transporter family protein [Thermoanaerobaculia bacterium]|nr:YeeE/YedE thiosulfate transporter family protein [Thermoanaerobaculia bacterium]
MSAETEPRPYADPYVAGAGLGLVLLAAFVIMGRGLGASGAFSSSAAGLVAAASPARAAASPFFARYLTGDGPWQEWLLFEIAGVAIGGFLSALAARRLRFAIERGPRVPRRARMVLAIAGGAIMGTGAVLARGCTSGLALTGGALLAAGSWLFMIAAFASAYLLAPLLRRAWR